MDMPDLTASQLPLLEGHRLPGIDLDDGFIYPFYAGRSVLNIPASVCRLLGAPGIGSAGALAPDLLDPLLAGQTRLRQVIVILVDALALHRLQHWLADGTSPVWQRLAGQGYLAPLTSLVPSTTSAVLTSLWTGRSPASHGTLGYEMWMKEYGVVINTILHAPITFKGEVGSLSKAGFDPEKYLPFPTLGSHLATQQIETHVFQHTSIARSGLSRMLFKDTLVTPFVSPAEMWVNLRLRLESRVGLPGYYYVYWGEIDHLGHVHGPADERTAGTFADFSAAFERQFLSRLSPLARRDTALILTADHGQVATPAYACYQLRNHPSLDHMLHIHPTGENRFMYLYARPGQVEAIRDYVAQAWPDDFAVLEPGVAIQQGLFGADGSHPRLGERVGDVILAARRGAYLWWGAEENPLRGRHGGLHPDEMLVPLLGVRLG
jgi:hypothetical protein